MEILQIGAKYMNTETKHIKIIEIEYEVKFKKIPDKLYTKKAKEIGRKRLDFMKVYFERFKAELDSIK